jgi:hypothetical protein
MSSVHSKEDAVLELERQLTQGRRLLEQPVHAYGDLVQVNAERAAWSLANKKLLLHLVGDASALTRCVSGSGDGEGPGNSLSSEIQRFRQLTMGQMAVLERMVLVMKRMA